VAEIVADAVKLPPGCALEWSGQYESMQRVAARLKLVCAPHRLPDPLPLDRGVGGLIALMGRGAATG
jgi:hypothetical protein